MSNSRCVIYCAAAKHSLTSSYELTRRRIAGIDVLSALRNEPRRPAAGAGLRRRGQALLFQPAQSVFAHRDGPLGRRDWPSCSSAPRAATASLRSASKRPSVDWKSVEVTEKIVWSRPFCNLIHFERALPAGRRRRPKLLIVAPMSGHYATLLRGTVEAMLPHADVYITDWADARMVPVTDGKLRSRRLYRLRRSTCSTRSGPDTHVMAVCQPSVPVLAAVALMEARGDRFVPATMTLMGGPIDTRRNPTAVNLLAEEKRHRLVPRQRDHAGAVAGAGLHARGLSRLPAAFRLHEHESRPPHHRRTRTSSCIS